MNYYVIVMNDNMILEKIMFSYRDEALHFVNARRRQGYIVTIKAIEIPEITK